MNLNRSLIQKEDCSSTWAETSAMQTDGRRVPHRQQRFREKSVSKNNCLCSSSRKMIVSARSMFIVDRLVGRTRFPQEGLHFYRRCDSILRPVEILETKAWIWARSGPKGQLVHYLLKNLHLFVMSRSAPTGWVKTMSHNLEWRHVWNPLLEYSEPQLQLSRLFMNGDQKLLVQINQTWF